MFFHKNHAAGGENSSIMVGMFVFLCLASQKPSEREFFIPARMDLGVKLLIYLSTPQRHNSYVFFFGLRAMLIFSRRPQT